MNVISGSFQLSESLKPMLKSFGHLHTLPIDLHCDDIHFTISLSWMWAVCALYKAIRSALAHVYVDKVEAIRIYDVPTPGRQIWENIFKCSSSVSSIYIDG